MLFIFLSLNRFAEILQHLSKSIMLKLSYFINILSINRFQQIEQQIILLKNKIFGLIALFTVRSELFFVDLFI